METISEMSINKQIRGDFYILSDTKYNLYAKEIDRLLVPTGKAYMLLTDHLITGWLIRFDPDKENGSSQTIHTYIIKSFITYLGSYI